MDYSRMGGAKKAAGTPKHGEHKRQQPKGKSVPKAELLARMKAAAAKAKPE